MKYYLIIFALAIFYSCVKDKPNAIAQPEVKLSTHKKVYVVNEGNLNGSNSSVSLYDPGTNSVIENIYQNQNNVTLGDVAQSLSYFNSKFYIVVNNSGKIEVCDNNFKRVNTITGLTSPRQILQISNSKAYISDLYANYLQVLNLNTNQVSSTISCSGWTENMAMIYNKVFVTNMKRDYVYIINAINDTKTDSVFVGPFAANVLIDKNDKVWVLSAGNSTAAISAALSRINPLTNAIEKVYTFSLTDYPGNLCFNKTKDTLYYLNNGICRMHIGDAALPASAFINKAGRNYYGLGINHTDYTIYASDAIDFVSKSNVYIFDLNGNEKSFFKAGINANGFYFE